MPCSSVLAPLPSVRVRRILSQLEAVAQEIGRHLDHYTVVITKSTVPVGTAATVRLAIASELAARGVEVDFDVASNPEFLKEGAAIADFMRPIASSWESSLIGRGRCWPRSIDPSC